MVRAYIARAARPSRVENCAVVGTCNTASRNALEHRVHSTYCSPHFNGMTGMKKKVNQRRGRTSLYDESCWHRGQ